ncbi:hypothetical protein [Paraburkholderia sp. J41]|uniref:hypothetical protein n=1 Tax=Paraburkholderia sp. J41 TaxID=2805433 RepID=UPI002AC345BC|nr:hypothetical protein [Paraburkholderia sp. J41]
MIAFFSLPLVSFLALALCAAFMSGAGAPPASRAMTPRRRPLLLAFTSLAIPIALLGVLLLAVRALLD